MVWPHVWPLTEMTHFYTNRGVAQVVARQFRVLEAASSSPATSTKTAIGHCPMAVLLYVASESSRSSCQLTFPFAISWCNLVPMPSNARLGGVQSPATSTKRALRAISKLFFFDYCTAFFEGWPCFGQPSVAFMPFSSFSSWLRSPLSFLNSCLGLFTAACFRRHPFFRSYGVNLPSSLTTLLPLALGSSPHLPVSVCGTGIHSSLFSPLASLTSLL